MKLITVTLPGAGLGKVLGSEPGKLGPTLASGQAWDALYEKKRGEDGRGIGWGDQFLPYKFIERTSER